MNLDVEWGFDEKATVTTLEQLDSILDEIHRVSVGGDIQTGVVITSEKWSISISLGGDLSHLEHYDTKCRPWLAVSYCATHTNKTMSVDSFGSIGNPPGHTFIDMPSAREAVRNVVRYNTRPRNVDWSCSSSDGEIVVIPAVG